MFLMTTYLIHFFLSLYNDILEANHTQGKKILTPSKYLLRL
jgi:hypothetical protein